MPLPFELPFDEVRTDLDRHVDQIFGALQSEFLTLPRGEGFIDYPVFEQGYEALKKATSGFRRVDPEPIEITVYQLPIALVVLRTILGFTPPEWAYAATQRSGVDIPQGAARTLDRNIRLKPLEPFAAPSPLLASRIRALVEVACALLREGAPPRSAKTLHRLEKADTESGLKGAKYLADMGVPYAMLLYERFLGRPFAGHRDSVSELVGDVLESAIESALLKAGISFRKTRRAEKLPGFDQAPDFIVPDEFAPQVVIEAKITEDDGTARDKVTRVQHLGALADAGGNRQFEVIACIAGRGFGVRREDMKKLLLATHGKVFTLQNLDSLVPNTRLSQFSTR